MKANIFYEPGISDSHIDAAKMSYEVLAHVQEKAPSVAVKKLDIELPTLPTGQIDSSFIDRVSVEDGSSAMFVMSRDLGARGLNFCFGRSAYNQHASIVSGARVEPTTMFGLGLHELGHSEGVVAESAPNYDRVTSFGGHCINLCVMQPVNNIDEMNATIEKFMNHPHSAGFCIYCARDLSSKG